MADQKISALTTNPGIDGTEEMPSARGGSNFKNTFTAFKTWLQGVLTFSGLSDAYDLPSSPVGSMPGWLGGTNLTPVQLFPQSAEDGFTIAVDVVTNAALPGTWNYANGTAGVGATLTKSINGALGNIDGVASPVNRTICIKNFTGANRYKNGNYIVTQPGTGGTPTILTRLTNSDTSAELDNQVVIAALGTVNKGLIFRQVTANPTVGTSNIVYQTNTVSAPSTAPTSITVAAAQALVTAGNVVVGRWYVVTNSSQRVDPSDRIWVMGATPDSFHNVAIYIDNVNGQTNRIVYKLDDVPTDKIRFREDIWGNEIWDTLGLGNVVTFPWANIAVRGNKILSSIDLTWSNSDVTNNLKENVFGQDCFVTDGGFNGLNVNTNKGTGVAILIGANGATCSNNDIGEGSSITCSNVVSGCTFGSGCVIDDGGFSLSGCTFPAGTTFTADKNYSNLTITNDGYFTSIKVPLSSSQIRTLDTVAVEAIPDPGPGRLVVPLSALFKFAAGTAYDDATDILIMNAAKTGSGEYLMKFPRNILNGSSSITTAFVDPADGSGGLIGNSVAHDAIVIKSLAPPGVVGTGTADVYIDYKVIFL